MHKRIVNDVHNALVKVSQNECNSVPEPLIHKLHLMGYIMPELHNQWLLTTEGKEYLINIGTSELP